MTEKNFADKVMEIVEILSHAVEYNRRGYSNKSTYDLLTNAREHIEKLQASFTEDWPPTAPWIEKFSPNKEQAKEKI